MKTASTWTARGSPVFAGSVVEVAAAAPARAAGDAPPGTMIVQRVSMDKTKDGDHKVIEARHFDPSYPGG